MYEPGKKISWHHGDFKYTPAIPLSLKGMKESEKRKERVEKEEDILFIIKDVHDFFIFLVTSLINFQKQKTKRTRNSYD